MTVKELKEKLEILIEDGKEDYIVNICGFYLNKGNLKIFVNDDIKEEFLK